MTVLAEVTKNPGAKIVFTLLHFDGAPLVQVSEEGAGGKGSPIYLRPEVLTEFEDALNAARFELESRGILKPEETTDAA